MSCEVRSPARPVLVVAKLLALPTLICLSTTGVTSAREPCDVTVAGEVLCDDFSDGSATDGIPVTWTPFNSTFAVESGSLIVRGSRIPQAALSPRYTLSDVSVRTTLRLVDGSSIGVAVRERFSPYVNYYTLLGEKAVIAIGGGGPNLAESGFLNLNLYEDDISLQFDVIGDQLTVWAWPADERRPAIPLAKATDSTILSAGEIFLFALGETIDGPASGRFLDVRIATTSIPEPSTAALALVVLAGAAMRARRRADLQPVGHERRCECAHPRRN